MLTKLMVISVTAKLDTVECAVKLVILSHLIESPINEIVPFV